MSEDSGTTTSPQVTFEPDPSPPDETRKGTMITIAGVLAILLATTGLTVVITSARRTEPSPLDFAAAASVRTMRMEATSTSTNADGDTFDMTFEGVFDLEQQLAAMTMTMTLPGVGEVQTEMVITSEYLFAKSPAAFRNSDADPAKPWSRSPLTDEMRQAFEGDSGPLNPFNDPTSYFDGLSSIATEVTEAGTETVRGVRTTKYDLTLDVEAFFAQNPQLTAEEAKEATEQFGSATMPAAIWIGEDGLPYRQIFTMKSKDATSTATFEFYGYNEDVDIQLPPRSQVQEAPEGSLGNGRSASCTFSQTGQYIGDGSEPSEPQPSPSVSCSPSP